MSARRIAAVTGLLGFVFVAATAAQGLGDTAARERAKRAAKTQAKKEPAKSFTNEDLEEGRPPGAKPETGSTQAAPQAAPQQEEQEAPSPAEDRLAQERIYLDAITAAQQGMTAAETRVRELSDKLNPMSLSYIYGAGGSNDASEELRVREELRQAESELQVARQTLATATRNLQDVRQGRRPESLEER
jgi:hypothetical protein